MLATHLGGAGGTIAWMLLEWKRDRRPSALGVITGAVAGLATITPASGFVAPMPALFIGFAAGVVCYYMVVVVKAKFRYDDSLDVFGVHGVGGFAGTMLGGVFATSAVNDVFGGAPVGLIEGNPGQVVNQLAACAASILIAGVGSWMLLKICDATVGVRMSQDEEIRGMDLALHGEEGYHFDLE
jgi:Amt family ammonium transporter